MEAWNRTKSSDLFSTDFGKEPTTKMVYMLNKSHVHTGCFLSDGIVVENVCQQRDLNLHKFSLQPTEVNTSCKSKSSKFHKH
jgi:hypothetical protein